MDRVQSSGNDVRPSGLETEDDRTIIVIYHMKTATKEHTALTSWLQQQDIPFNYERSRFYFRTAEHAVMFKLFWG